MTFKITEKSERELNIKIVWETISRILALNDSDIIDSDTGMEMISAIIWNEKTETIMDNWLKDETIQNTRAEFIWSRQNEIIEAQRVLDKLEEDRLLAELGAM